jgi:hypothetical protein
LIAFLPKNIFVTLSSIGVCILTGYSCPYDLGIPRCVVPILRTFEPNHAGCSCFDDTAKSTTPTTTKRWPRTRESTHSYNATQRSLPPADPPPSKSIPTHRGKLTSRALQGSQRPARRGEREGRPNFLHFGPSSKKNSRLDLRKF